jgi:hypothetical protein
MENIYDVLRRYEFNKTEAETLQELVKRAVEKGNAAQQELRTLAKAAQLLAPKMLSAGVISVRAFPPALVTVPPLVGIDGSCQEVGGFGGKWYVPISCAIVKALKGSLADLEVEIVANIEELQQQEFQNVARDVSRIMMTIETKAIGSWAKRAPAESTILLDGPVVDPPAEDDRNYVNLRCAALKACLVRNITVVGCVKRSFDLAFRKHAAGILRTIDAQLAALLAQFPTDSQLLIFLLSSLARTASPFTYLHTAVIPIETNRVTELYFNQELRIVFAYLQRDLGASILRVEAIVPSAVKDDAVPAFMSSVLDLCVGTIYPGHYIPLPVQMAHDKCNIREGCAEVLYDEIMTRARSSDPLEQIVLSKLR